MARAQTGAVSRMQPNLADFGAIGAAAILGETAISDDVSSDAAYTEIQKF